MTGAWRRREVIWRLNSVISGDEMHTDSSALAVLGEQLMMNKRLLSKKKLHSKWTVFFYYMKRV